MIGRNRNLLEKRANTEENMDIT